MAAVDYFLKLDGIKGESQDDKHKDEIQIESWSWGELQQGTSASGGGAGAGKVTFHDFGFTKSIDTATPKLMLACAQGEHIKSAVLTCRKAGKDQQEFLKYTLTDVLVASHQVGGSSVVPTDQFSLNFSKIEVEYHAQKADGSLGGAMKAGYDIKAQKTY